MKKLFLLSLFFVFACNTKDRKKEIKKPEKSISNYVDLNNKPVDLSIYKGKKVLINYWATWCGPCIKEMPDLLKAQEILKEYNYVFLLTSDEDFSVITDFKNKTNYNFTFLKYTKSLSTIGIYAMPTSVVLDVKGNKVETIVGSVKWNSEEMIQKLKAL